MTPPERPAARCHVLLRDGAGLTQVVVGAATDLAPRRSSKGPFRGYLDGFRRGMPHHGGFALGLERFVAQVAGAANIRETTLFPRDRSRLSP